jgi:hypothetical protein
MPMPSVVGVGVGNSGLGAVTYAYPAGYTAVADDVAVTLIETESEAVVPPTNWATLSSSTVASGTITRINAIWRRLTAAEAAPAVADPGNHQVGRMIVIRDCVTTGNPYEAATINTELVADLSVSIGGATTGGVNRLILAAFSTGQDVATTAGVGTWVNAALANIAEQMDNWAVDGLGGGLAMVTGEKAAAGAWGATTATMVSPLTAQFKALLSFAMIGATAVADPPGLLMRSPRPIEQSQAAGPYTLNNPSTFLGG